MTLPLPSRRPGPSPGTSLASAAGPPTSHRDVGDSATWKRYAYIVYSEFSANPFVLSSKRMHSFHSRFSELINTPWNA